MFTESGSRLGWRTGASRLKIKPQLDQLQSFDPGERAEAGRELVEMGLSRTAHALLDHVANEFDDRVLAAIASAVRAAPTEEDESRRARELREWAVSELDRLRLEDAFMSGAAAGAPSVPEAPEAPARTMQFTAAQVDELRAELPLRLPVPPTTTAAVPGTSWAAPPEPAPTPAPGAKQALPYIYWRAPIELTTTTSAPSAGPGRTRLPTPAPPPIESHFDAPSAPPAPVERPAPPPPAPPAPDEAEVRFETPPAPAPTDPVTEKPEPPTSSVGLTLAERLKARAG